MKLARFSGLQYCLCVSVCLGFGRAMMCVTLACGCFRFVLILPYFFSVEYDVLPWNIVILAESLWLMLSRILLTTVFCANI